VRILISSALTLSGMFLLALCAAEPATEDAKLAAFCKAYLDEEFKARPLEATRQGDHRFDHQLDDVSPAARKRWMERYRNTLAELPKKIDRGKLSRAGQIDFEILQHALTQQIWLRDNADPYRDDPRVYNDYLTESVYLLLTQSTLPKADNVRNATARLAYLPRIVEAAKASLGNPPKVMTETAILQNHGAIAFYEKGIYDLAGETPALSDLKPAADRVLPVLRAYQKFLEEELLPRSTGEWRIGKGKFARKLELELNAGLSSDEVLKDAESEFVRVERDMYVMARQLWARTFPKKPLPPDDEAGRTATIAAVLAELNKNHGEVNDLPADARKTVERIKKFIREKDILRLPGPDQCKIIEMPEFQRGFSVAYLNPAPPLDAKASSYYAISPPPKDWDARRVESFMQEYNRDMLAILSIHEGYPGHYVQLEYGNRNPSVIRKVLYSGVFAEGWAVYTEQMMLDQGFRTVEGGEDALRLQQLKWYLRSVANAVLDHRMHCSGWSDKEAMDFLTKRAFQSEGEALGKVKRAKLSSCQLSTYFVGRMAFYRLRQKVQRELGEKFELGRYHEAVLDHGTLPVKYLPELVRERLKKPR
jgi:uncharacterized protein (DUF885 family)